MASNLTNLSSKLTAGTGSTLSAAQFQAGPLLSTGENYKRSGGSGSFGQGSSSRATGATPRKQQASKNQHKHSRRYRLTDEDALAESAAMNSTRNRQGQTSITHLMTFALPPRPTSHQNHFHQSRHAKRTPTWGLGSGYHVVDKARYVHANYRFIVDPRRDYQRQSVDADIYLDWNNILQIIASSQTQPAACPICLGDTVAPRMARCGHIFCLHCLIRFMHSNEDTIPLPEKRARWKRCPICEDTIYISETRPVRWYLGQEGTPPHERDDVVLRLLVRRSGSTLALPKDTHPPAESEEIPWHFAVDVMDYARVMKGSEDYMMAQYDDESAQIEEMERHDELMFGEDPQWTRRAVRAINEAKEKLVGMGNAPVPAGKPVEEKGRRRVVVSGSDASGASGATLEEEPKAEIPQSRIPDTMPVDTSASEITRARDHHRHQPAQQSDYYFYQALSHYYLSPLDIRILKTAFGEFSQFPSTILPRVEHISTGHVIDDDLRKRTKYLSHLPRGCEVAFLECDWTDTVPAEVLERFRQDIEKRRRRHNEKNAREEKERIRAEREEEDKRYAAARRRRPTSPAGALKLRPEDFEPLAGGDVLGTGAAEGAVDSDTNGHESTSPMWRPGVTSFASLGSPGTSPNASRTVWGTTVIAPTSPVIPTHDLEPPQDDGWLQGWERDLLAEDQLVVAAEDARLQDAQRGGNQAQGGGGSGGGGRKKKGKKITLMSTAGGRRAA